MSTFASQKQRNNAGAIAQLVEQRTENPCVPGSIPGGTTAKKEVEKINFLFLLCIPFCLYYTVCTMRHINFDICII